MPTHCIQHRTFISYRHVCLSCHFIHAELKCSLDTVDPLIISYTEDVSEVQNSSPITVSYCWRQTTVYCRFSGRYSCRPSLADGEGAHCPFPNNRTPLWAFDLDFLSLGTHSLCSSKYSLGKPMIMNTPCLAMPSWRRIGSNRYRCLPTKVRVFVRPILT